MQEKDEKNFDPIKRRMLEYIKNKGITRTKFFTDLDMRQSNFAGKGLKSALSTTSLVKFLTIYNDISIKWLLFGEGEPLNSFSTPNEREGSLSGNTKLVELTAQLKYVEKMLAEKEEIIIQLKIELEKKNTLSLLMKEFSQKSRT